MPRKARALSELLIDHEGPLTADFQRIYGLRLQDAVVDRSETEVLDLIVWIPKGSAFHASLEAKGDEDKARKLYGWTSVEELLLGLFNATSTQTYVLQQVNSQKRITQPKPIPGPRGSKPASDGASATGIARALLAAQ